MDRLLYDIITWNPTMTSSLIKTLLQPPSKVESEKYATSVLNSSFSTLALVESGDVFPDALRSAQANANELHTQVHYPRTNASSGLT